MTLVSYISFWAFQIVQIHEGIFLSQPIYVMHLLKSWLKQFKMDDYKPCATPFQLGFFLTKECDSPKVDATGPQSATS